MTGQGTGYGSAAAFRTALNARTKAEAKRTGRQVQDVRRRFLFDRFLCRVYAGTDGKFLLKGGTAMLARVADARATRDVDFAATDIDGAEAIDEVRKLASVDLGDFIRFEFKDSKQIGRGHQQPEVDVWRLRFETYLGITPDGGLGIDLSIGNLVTGVPEVRLPEWRLDMNGITDREYRLYPVVDQIAEKVCASLSGYGRGGRESSRVKDLVDLVILARTYQLDSRELGEALTQQANIIVTLFCLRS